MSISNQPAGKKEAAAERRVKSLELRKAGASYRRIGDQLGISETMAYKDVQRCLTELRELQNHSAEELRTMELERLDMAMLAIAAQVKAGHLGAIDRWIRLAESRRRLLGLDAATKAEITGAGGGALTLNIQWTNDADGSSDHD